METEEAMLEPTAVYLFTWDTVKLQPLFHDGNTGHLIRKLYAIWVVETVLDPAERLDNW
jgi:hypothetical protein